MEKIIHFTVREPENLSSVQADVINRARNLHPTWEIKVWGDDAVRRGCDFFLERYWPNVNSGAQLSDLLRLDLLYRYGGVYVDSDLKLFKPLDDLVDKFAFFIASEDGVHLTNAIIGACKENPALRQLIDELNSAEPDWKLSPNITTGPKFFSKQLRWRKDITVLPRETFYTYAAFSNEPKQIHRHSYGEHLWAHSWRSVDVNYSAPRRAERNVIAHAWESLKRPIKKHLKGCVVFGFRIWHRLQLLNPVHRLPRPRQKSYERSGELVVQTVYGHKIVADGHDVSITPELAFNGFYELPEQLFLINVVKGGDWVIDIGANIGTFSLLAAHQVGSFGRVFAFEPNPRPSMLMAKSLVMNWMHERVVQRPVAVGKSNGTIKLTFASDCLGDGRIGNVNDAMASAFVESLKILGPGRTVVLDVPCVRLDEEFPVDLPIKVLKIDAEGYEGFVLAGADRLLRRRCIDYILIELSEEISGALWQDTLRQVTNAIGYGYSIYTLAEDGGLIEQKELASAIGAGHRNIVLVAQEQYIPT